MSEPKEIAEEIKTEEAKENKEEKMENIINSVCATLEEEIIKMSNLHKIWREREMLEMKIVEKENEIVAELKKKKKYSPMDIDSVIKKRRRKRTEIEKNRKKAELEE